MHHTKTVIIPISFFFICLFSCDSELIVTPDDNQVFIKFFGTLDNDEGAKIAELKGSGYLLLGTTAKTGIIAGEAVTSKALLIMTDYLGEVVWESEIGGNSNYKAGAITVSENNEIFISGTLTEENGLNTNIFLTQISNAGEQLWLKEYENPGISTSAVEMVYTSDNTIVIIGNTNASIGDEIDTGTQDFYVLKADLTGEIIWERTYGFEEGKTDYGNALVETDNGDFIWIGTTQKDNISTPGLNSDMRVVRSNQLGNLIWDFLFGGEGNDFGNKVITQNNEYLMVGAKGSTFNNNGDIFLVKINTNGEEIWSKVYGGDSDENAFDIIATNDNGYVIAGYTFSYGNGKSDIFLVKTDINGNMEWQSAIGGQGDDNAKSIIQTADGGFLVAGTIQFENNTMISLIKTNTLGTTTSP